MIWDNIIAFTDLFKLSKMQNCFCGSSVKPTQSIASLCVCSWGRITLQDRVNVMARVGVYINEWCLGAILPFSSDVCILPRVKLHVNITVKYSLVWEYNPESWAKRIRIYIAKQPLWPHFLYSPCHVLVVLVLVHITKYNARKAQDLYHESGRC